MSTPFLAPYMEILELQLILTTAIPALSRHFPVQVFLSKITFLFVLVRAMTVWVHALRGQSKAWGTLLYCSLPITLRQGMLLNQLGPSKFSGSVISASRYWGYWHSQPLGVLIGVLGTLTRVLMFAKASALTHSQNFFLTCIMHACWSFNGEHRYTGLPCIRQSFGCWSCIRCLVGTLAELPGFLRS